MTVATTIDASGPYYPNGATVAFPFLFDAGSIDDVEVVIVAADGSETTVSSALYTVTLAGGDAAGGTVTYAAAPAALAVGSALWVVLSPSFEQMIGFVDEGAFNQSMLNPMADEAARRAIWLRSRLGRALLTPYGEAGIQLPVAASRANTVMHFDGAGALDLIPDSQSSEVAAQEAALQAEIYAAQAAQRQFFVANFAAIATTDIPATVNSIVTEGYVTAGDGGQATYVNDASATAGLAAAHPRACSIDDSAAPRYWRLIPTLGEITAAQLGAFGSDLASSTTDERVALQAGFDYAIATGAALILPKPYYTYNQEARTAADTDIYADRSGVGMVVEGGHLVVKSGCGFTRVRRRAPNGGDPAVWANWPLLSGGAGWRGGLVFLAGTVAAPAEFSDRAGLTTDGVLFDGGIPRGASYGALNTGTGDGWDVTDKGLWGEGDRYKGDVDINNGGFIGCRGEVTYYQGGDKNDRKFKIRKGILGDTNGSALNIEGASLDIDGLFIYKCSKWSESWGGPNGRVVNTVVYDCINDGFVQAGIPGLGAMPPSIGYPTRYVADAYGPLGDGRLPTLDLQITFIKGGTAVISPWTNIDIVAKDTGVDIGNNTQLLDASYGLPWKQISGRLTLVTDTMNNVSNLTILGGQTAGKVNTDEISLDVKVQRTESAATAGYNYPRIYHERSLGPNIRINLDAPNGSSPPTTTLGLTDYMPIYSGTFWDNVMQVLTSQNVETTPALTPTSPIMGLTGTTAGWHNFSVITTAGKIQKGQRIRVLNSIGGAHTFLIRPSGDGLVASDHQVLPLNEFMDLRFQGNHGGWEVLKAPNRYKAAAAPTVGTWAIGATVENNAPAAAGFAEWRCVTAGTPGTWKTANPISA